MVWGMEFAFMMRVSNLGYSRLPPEALYDSGHMSRVSVDAINPCHVDKPPSVAGLSAILCANTGHCELY